MDTTETQSTTESTMSSKTRIVRSNITSTLAEAQKRAQTRCLSDVDVDRFVGMVRKARAFAKRHGLPDKTVNVEINGGGVPNSYRYMAETSVLRYMGGELFVGREKARSGPHGNTLERFARIHIGSIADHQKLRQARLVKRFHGGFAYLVV
jgi:hypothetical protein